MNIVNKIILLILSLPKTIYINFKYLKFKEAIKLPILVSYKVKLAKTRGSILIKSNIKFGMIQIGFGGHIFFEEKQCYLYIDDNAKLCFESDVKIASGSRINVIGTLIFKRNFRNSASLKIDCRKKITFGENVLVGWNCTVLDTDGHDVLDKSSNKINFDNDIYIGNNVWIGANVTILKGVKLNDGIIIAYGTTITKSIKESNCIIGGVTNKVLKKEVYWVK